MASDIWCYSSSATRCLYSDSVQWKSVLVWVLLVITTLPAVLSQNQGPSTDFSRHQIIRPKIYHARHKREISSTKENDIEHVDVLSVHYELDGVERILDLRLNKDLIPYGYQQRHQHKGTYKVHTPTKVELCHYQGGIRDVPGSWAAISTCNGLQGVIYDGIDLHHLHPEIETLNSKHYIYKHKDLIGNRTCGYEGTPHDFLAGDLKKSHRASRHKRATETIRGPYNANRQSRYVELVLVIDKKEYMAFDENLDKVYQRCKDIANIINAFYMPLNVFIALVGVEVWSDSDEIPLSVNGDSTLSSFLRYRRETLVKAIPNDNAQLLTRIQFDGGVVGKALKGPICTYEFSGGVSSDHSNQVGVVAATVAHEIGHNFGMEHDAPSPECECPEERCIMAPSSGSAGPVHWSSCSLDYLALAFEHGMDYCLRNKPQKLFDSPVCGNSFVEPGEQCDCGLKENCNNPCCDASTCMLHANASCATGQCCDLKTCRPKTAGTECRSAEHECDLPEYCTGQSEYCPNDVYKIDGEPCNMGKAYCYQGSCRTHNDQCKLLWGPTGVSSDPQCYSMNNKGNKNGNCGFNRIDSSYYKCNNKSILCGMLHCKHLNERLEFGMESVATLSHSFINSQGNIIACRSAIVDLGLNEIDPGLAPDGAKCGPGKMCVNQKCMPVADLRAKISEGHACPNNCGGNGVCNSLGHCHCNRGFQYPDCTQPGFGGSEDSGPAEDPNARNDFVTATYIIFLGVLPTIGLVLFGLWYRRNNPNKQWNKGALSKYVFNVDCFKPKRKPCAPTTIPVYKSQKGLSERILVALMPKKNPPSPPQNTNKIFSLSDQLSNKEKLEIVKSNLVSTTNPDMINCSNNIQYRNSLNDPKVEFRNQPTLKIEVNSNENQSDATSKRISPLKMDLGSKLADHIQQFQKGSNRNFKGLKVQTELKFEQLNESPSSTSGTAPNTCETLLKDKSNLTSKAPFYNKKPPPPPQ